MMQWINQQTFDGLAFTNKDGNLQETVRQESELLKALREFVPEAELCYRISYDENGCENYCHSVCTCFRRDGILFFVRKQTYPKTNYLISFDWSNLKYADNGSYHKAFQHFDRPNHIGVLSRRKIDDRVNYFTEGYRNMERIDRENEPTIGSFRKRLEALPEIIWSSNNKGSIERNGLIYSFEIHPTYYYEQVRLDSRLQTLDDFLVLSDNQYKRQ
mgnify:CR=1 FL=1